MNDATRVLFEDTLIPPIRLAELSVCNWGPFEGIWTAPIHPDGSLITGETGAGKSSLIDALQVLFLTPGRATFNTAAAQNDRSDRSLMTYIRGKFRADDVSDEQATGGYARRGATTAGVRALFAQGERKFTFAALFWVSNSSTTHADVHRQYIIADRQLDLKELLDRFSERQIKELKKSFEGDSTVTFFKPNTFSDYEVVYKQYLHFENQNAPALLGRALGLKKIDNLTSLIQDLVLDTGESRELAAKVVANFDDLKASHAEMVETRRQRDLLAPLPELSRVFDELTARIALLERQRAAAPRYLRAQWTRLWRDRLLKRTRLYETSAQITQQAEAAHAACKEDETRLHGIYLKAGGAKIDELRRGRDAARNQLVVTQQKAREYRLLAVRAGVTAATNHAEFLDSIAAISDMRDAVEGEVVSRRNKWADARSEREQIEREKLQVEVELEAAKLRKDSNVPYPNARARVRLCEALELDVADLPYAAELIDVRESEHIWKPAIEREMGGIGLTLLVNDDLIKPVTKWINQTKQGVNLFWRHVTDAPVQPQAFDPKGMLFKLEWKEHPYRNWLRTFLARRDLTCVETEEAMRSTPNSMTKEGSVHRTRGGYEKRDAKDILDQESWCLGFSNAQRVRTLSDRLQILARKLHDAKQQVEACDKDVTNVEQQRTALEALSQVEWETIDEQSKSALLDQAQRALDQAEAMGEDLAKAEKSWQDARESTNRANTAWADAKSLSDGYRTAMEEASRRIAQYELQVDEPDDEETTRAIAERVGALEDEAIDRSDSIQLQVLTGIDDEVKRASRQASEAREKCAIAITTFHESWGLTVAADWGSGFDALPEYLAYFHKVDEEGLPELEGKFKELLNGRATQALQSIDEQLRNERENIKDRIDAINAVMAKTELRKGSHLELTAKQQIYDINQTYDKLVARVRNLSTSTDHEARYVALKDVVDMLAKAIHPDSWSTKESLRLLDTRYQFDFVATEYVGTGEHRKTVDNWTSSSGKSGGEKESFAGTIVAASLAYVLAPIGQPRPVYTSVILDEAFSNTSLAYSRRVLRSFRELGLHLSLITPFKNIELAREHARSIVLVARDQKQHRATLSEITWEYVDKMLSSGNTAAEARSLGVEVLQADG